MLAILTRRGGVQTASGSVAPSTLRGPSSLRRRLLIATALSVTVGLVVGEVLLVQRTEVGLRAGKELYKLGEPRAGSVLLGWIAGANGHSALAHDAMWVRAFYGVVAVDLVHYPRKQALDDVWCEYRRALRLGGEGVCRFSNLLLFGPGDFRPEGLILTDDALGHALPPAEVTRLVQNRIIGLYYLGRYDEAIATFETRVGPNPAIRNERVVSVVEKARARARPDLRPGP